MTLSPSERLWKDPKEEKKMFVPLSRTKCKTKPEPNHSYELSPEYGVQYRLDKDPEG